MTESRHSLFLIRHGQAEENYLSGADHGRKLTAVGKNEAVNAGVYTQSRLDKESVIYTSSAARTTETAFLALPGFKKQIRILDDLYLASVKKLLDLVHGFPESLESAVIVGHNPGLTQLVNRLTRDKLDNLPPGGVIWIRSGHSKWCSPERRGEIAGYYFPPF